MKAWRKEAEQINARRKAGSKEATARVQKNEKAHLAKVFPIKYGSNFLLSLCFIKGGFKWAWEQVQEPEYLTPRAKPAPEEGSVLKLYLAKARAFLSKHF